MTINLVITNDEGEIVEDLFSSNYKELLEDVKMVRPAVKDMEEGGRGFSVCPGCEEQYKIGEDTRVDNGGKCSNCTYN